MKKNLLIRLFAIAFIVSLVTSCSEDLEPVAAPPAEEPVPPDEETPVTVSYAEFIPANAIVKENNPEGHLLQIQLSESLAAEGKIVVEVNSNAVYGRHFITEPAFTDGKLQLPIAPESKLVFFKVIPIDNGIITGEREIKFNISQTSSNIRKGSKVTEAFKIYDDELTNKPKGYEIGAGQWGLKETREYDSLGRISKVYIETSTPAKTTRTETYYYSPAGELEKINLYPGIDKVFTWQNGRIIKSAQINHGVLKSYIAYSYDDHGNISGMVTYYLQQDGQFAMGGQFAYLYFTDGNVYKSFSFAPSKNGEEPILLSTKTYDGYIDSTNPFPMVNILPTVQTQTKLPTIYKLEQEGVEFVYDLSYEFGDNGLLKKRTASSAQGSEIAVYSYY